jgi:flavodoxin
MESLKIFVVYDSRTGNTEKLARAIAAGAAFIDGVVVEVRKIGESFSLSKLAEADLAVFGSPVRYANVTEEMRWFLSNLRGFIETGRMKMEGKRAAVFGSYGYDGAWIMEEMLRGMLETMGYDVHDKICVEIDSNLRLNPVRSMERCRAFGKTLAESLIE